MVLLVGLALTTATGCTGTDGGDSDEPGASVTYFRDVQPVIATHCGACHVDGGSAPFSLDSYDKLVTLAPIVRTAIETGAMPPWSADPECRSFQHERLMSEADKATVLGWIDEGMAEGDPADAQPIDPPNLDLEQVSAIARSLAPYTPDSTTPDDYHCLVLDVEFPEPTYLAAHQVVPDESGYVHHIIFYLVPPSGVPAMLAQDADTPEAGYDCFGSSGHGGQPMGVWAPGGLPMRFPADSAFVIPQGSRIVAQMHYNAVAGPPTPDQTELHLAYLDGEPQLRVTMPILNGFFTIPAGDPAYRVEFEYAITGEQPKQIFSVMPHMHLLGRTIDVRRVRDDDETCVARVNDWEFQWQQFYDLKESEFIEVRAGDTLRYSCVFDNSAENEPIVDGQQQTPGPVGFGEGTLDEMCLNVVAMVEPFVADGPAPMCEGFNQCFEQNCTPDDGVCFFECGAQGTPECSGCVLENFAACGQAVCPSEMAAVVTCLGTSCDADLSDIAGIQACLANECAAPFDAAWACIGPKLLAGECNDNFAPCGIEYE